MAEAKRLSHPVQTRLPDTPDLVPSDSVPAVSLKAARPGSQWATGKRKAQKGFSQPKGFARGARIK